MITRRSPLIALLLITSSFVTAHADWTLDGVPLCAEPGSQFTPRAVSDGAGGAIVVWWDLRTGEYDVYAQRIDDMGNALWTPDGVPICTAAGGQIYPCITSDGAGGAIIAWEDLRNEYDVFAQRVNAAGVVQWAANGIAVCALALTQLDPSIVSDGAGGAVVAWTDFRSATNSDIYAQRINAAGITQWTLGGVLIAATPGTQNDPVITTDDANGAIIAWSDATSGHYDIFVRRVDASGVPQWTNNGVPLGVAAGVQAFPVIASDGAGGAIVAWQDRRSGQYDIYARRVQSNGVPFWGDAGGTAVTTAVGDQTELAIDGDLTDHGAFIAWRDERSGTGDIYAQRMNQLGGKPWSTNGVPVCTAVNHQSGPSVVHDGDLGVIVTWMDIRSGQRDIYVQRVNAGLVTWPVDGLPICTAANQQFTPVIVSDGEFGGIVAWQDGRDGLPDIYAQRIYASGSIPTPVRDTPSLRTLSLDANYPNPFSANTVFELELSRDSHVTADVFDVAGRRVRTQSLGQQGAGLKAIPFDGRDDMGRPLASGVYFYRVTANGTTVSRKMVIAR